MRLDYLAMRFPREAVLRNGPGRVMLCFAESRRADFKFERWPESMVGATALLPPSNTVGKLLWGVGE